MAKNNTLADLDAFLKEQNQETVETTTESVTTTEEFVSQTPHQIVETSKQLEENEYVAQTVSSTPKVRKHIADLVPEQKTEASVVVQWAEAINETVKRSEMLKSVPLLNEVVDSCTEQVKATEKFIETSQNIWKKLWS